MFRGQGSIKRIALVKLETLDLRCKIPEPRKEILQMRAVP